MKLRFANLVRNSKTGMASVSRQWYVKSGVDTEGRTLWEPVSATGLTEDAETNASIINDFEEKMKELQEKDIDTLILGCTHYPLLRSTIRKIMGDQVCLVNPAYETALELGRLLKEKELSGTGTVQADFPYRFYVSDLADEFKAFANSILPYDVEMTKKIDIEKY